MNAVPFSFFKADDTWALWTFLIVAAYVCILLEHKYKWASQISGAVLALIIGLVAANLESFLPMPLYGMLYGILSFPCQ